MPKMKTHRGAAKRMRRTATNKIKRTRAFGEHLLTHKTAKRKRRLRKPALAHPSNMRALDQLLPRR